MVRRCFRMLLLLLGCALFAAAQAQPSNPRTRPETLDAIYALGVVQNTPIPLERREFVLRAGPRPSPIWPFSQTTRRWLEIPGEKSPLRLRADQGIEFAIPRPRGNTQALMLLHLEVKDGKRQVILSTTRANALGSHTESDPSRADYTLQRDGPGWKLTPTAALPPGEYGILWGLYGRAIFCFGVDPAPPAQAP